MATPPDRPHPTPTEALATDVRQVPEHVMEAVEEADGIAEELDCIASQLEQLAEDVYRDRSSDLSTHMARALKYAAHLTGLRAREHALMEFDYLERVVGGADVSRRFIDIGWIEEAVQLAAHAMGRAFQVERVHSLLMTCECACRGIYRDVRTRLARIGYGDFPDTLRDHPQVSVSSYGEKKVHIDWRPVIDGDDVYYEAVVKPIVSRTFALAAFSLMIVPIDDTRRHLGIFLGPDFDQSINILDVDLPSVGACQEFAQGFMHYLLCPLSVL